MLGIAIATQVRQTESGDALETARPADLLVLLDSLQQREAALNTEVAELQRTLASLQASGSSDQAAIDNARSRLAALSILIGTVAATGPGCDDHHRRPGRAAWRPRPCSTSSTNCGPRVPRRWRSRAGNQAVRVGVDTWVVGRAGALAIDGLTLAPPYSVLAIGDPPTLAAAMNIPGGAVDSVERVGGTMTVAAIRACRHHHLAATETAPIRSARQMTLCPAPDPRTRRSTVSEIPPDLHYTAEHEWVRRTGDDTVRVGITDFAQSALGDVVFVQLPDADGEVAAGESFGEVESTKSVSDLYAPLIGESGCRQR